MELQEDAYRLQQVLTNVSYKEIVGFLREKVPFSDTEIRCRIALQYFFNKEREVVKSTTDYNGDLKADFLCVRHLLKTVPDEEIANVLKILGPIPNRKLVAAKLLLHQTNTKDRKRKKYSNTIDEASETSTSSKLIKVADSTDSVKTIVNGKDHSKIPKLVLKRDRNANEFVVSPKKSLLSEIPPFKPQYTAKIDDIYLNDAPPEVVVTEEPSSSTYGPDNAVPGTSRIVYEEGGLDNAVPGTSRIVYEEGGLDNAVPGTSRIVYEEGAGSLTLSVEETNSNHPTLDDLVDAMDHDSDDTVIDLSSTANSVILLDAIQDSPVADLPNLPVAVQVEEQPLEEQPLEEQPNVHLPVDEKLVLKIMEVFPQALPEYIRKICAGKVWSDATFADMVDVILNDEYPRRPERTPTPEKEVDPEDQLCTLKALLPDADPTFLQEKLEQLGGDQEALRHFIEDAVDNKTYPTMKEYLRKQQLSAQQRQYTTEFDVERFVEIFPDPVAVFEDPHRKTTILNQEDRYYVKWLMRSKYSQLYVKDINGIVETQGSINVISIVKALDKCLKKGCVKKTKISSSRRPDCQNIPLLQELAYFEHKIDILKHIEAKKKQAAEDRENAKHMGMLQSCSCCFDDEVMPCDILTCTGGCRFCRECIRRSTEVGFSEGKVNFPCFSDGCDAEFALQVLQNVLPPKLFSKLAQKKAVAEVKAAGVEDLETCPFCDFANIPAPEDKLFRCLNPDCMKESCRLCKEPSHVPLRCEEVEKDEAIKARTYIENKMTEALIRECWQCGAKFIKEEGCNKMTCSCGAMMCYICRQPVKDYKHFNGQGGDRHDLCPLYTDNFSVNEKNVMKAAEEAKKEIDPAQLKNDPTADLQIHFADKIKEAENKAQQQTLQRLQNAPEQIEMRIIEMQRNMARLRQAYARDERGRPRHRHQAAFHVHVQRGHRRPHVQVQLNAGDLLLHQEMNEAAAQANQAIEQ